MAAKTADTTAPAADNQPAAEAAPPKGDGFFKRAFWSGDVRSKHVWGAALGTGIIYGLVRLVRRLTA